MSVYQVDAEKFLVQKIHGRWTAFRWCDCVLGSHWHRIGTYPNRKALEVELGLNVEERP